MGDSASREDGYLPCPGSNVLREAVRSWEVTSSLGLMVGPRIVGMVLLGIAD